MIAGLAFLMISCGNEKKEKSSESGSVVEMLVILQKLLNQPTRCRTSNTLKKLTPLTMRN